MKFIRYKEGKVEYRGILDGNIIRRINGSIFHDYHITNDRIPFERVTILPPVTPNKIISIKNNYNLDKCTQTQQPYFFLKPTSSVIGYNNNILYPKNIDSLTMESGLAIVISKKGKDIPIKRSKEHILGYTIGNDITALSSKFHQNSSINKSFDTFTPLGDVLDTNLNTKDIIYAPI